MALVTLSLPDEVLLKYGSYNPDRPEDALVDQIKRFADVPTGRPAIVLSGEAFTTIQKLKNGLSVENATQLLNWVKSLVEFSIGGVKYSLSEAQTKKVRQLAGFWNKEFKDALGQAVKQGMLKELGV